jgi:hypothetical protein
MYSWFMPRGATLTAVSAFWSWTLQLPGGWGQGDSLLMPESALITELVTRP